MNKLLYLLFICLFAFAGSSTGHYIPPKKFKKAVRDSISRELEQMLAEDQRYRWMIMLGETNAQKLAELRRKPVNVKTEIMRAVMKGERGISKAQKDSLWTLQHKIDATNFAKALGIIRKYGYPLREKDASAMSTILLHTPIKRIPDDFYELLLAEVTQKRMEPKEYASIYDKLQLVQDQARLYYVSLIYDSVTKTYRAGKPINPQQTDSARKAIGLKPLKK